MWPTLSRLSRTATSTRPQVRTARLLPHHDPGEQAAKTVNFDPRRRPGARLDDSVKGALLRGERVGAPGRPGVLACVQPPDRITRNVQVVLRKVNREVGNHVEEYLAAGVKLRNHLHGRHPPQEESVYRERINQVKMSLLEAEYATELSNDALSTSQLDEIETEMEKRAEAEVKRRTHHWKPVVYDEAACYAYLLAKSPFDYATALRVMSEIREREPDFQPRTIFDYGSGVGSAIWAAQETFGTFTEIFAVDTSPDMNNLARLILLEGKATHSLPAGTFFRMTLPSSNDLTYDLVTCTHSLLDLPNEEARLTAIDNLWRKTSGFLVLIEDGTNAGFQVLAEARDYIIQLSKLKLDSRTRTQELEGNLFAPCPHSSGCPRYFHDVVPCNFDVRYKTFQLPSIPQEIRDLASVHRFSYLVFKKGKGVDDRAHFPRLLSTPFLKKHKAYCRMCTSRGKLEEYLAAKKGADEDAKFIYQYARRLKCGDQMRVYLSDEKPPTWFQRKRMQMAQDKPQDVVDPS